MRAIAALLAVIITTVQPALSEHNGCNAYQGWESIAEQARSHVIFFAEVHGSNESPEAVRGLICELAAQGIPIRYGIETPKDQELALNQALNPPLNKTHLQAAAPILWSTHDGHSSKAVLELLTYFSELRAGGAKIDVFAFVDGNTPERRSLGNETTMARNIDAASVGFDGAVIVLIGGAHATLNPLNSGRIGGSAATEINEREPLVLKMQHEAGAIWAMMYNAQGDKIPPPQRIGANLPGGGPKGAFVLASGFGYESGYYYTGPLTPSPPAFPQD